MTKNFKTLIKNQQGMSLLEILIAFFILTFMMVSVNSIVDQSITSKDVILSEDREFLSAQTAIARLENDFQHIYSPEFFSNKYNPKADPFNYMQTDENENERSFQDEESKKTVDLNRPYERHPYFSHVTQNGHPVPIISNPEKNSLQFLTLSNRRKVRNTKESNYAWVRYSIISMEEDEDEENEFRSSSGLYQWVREYSTSSLFDEKDPFEDSKNYILLKYIKEYSLTYWSPKEQKFMDRVKDVMEEKGKIKKTGEHLLRSLKVSITWVDKNGQEQTIERVINANWPKFEPEDMTNIYKTKKDREADMVEVKEDDETRPN